MVSDLADFNIFSELTIEHCGFTEQGEFRVFVPPLHVLNDRKLTPADRQRMNTAASNIFKYWQSERLLPNENSNGHTTSRLSYRFNSPQGKKESQPPPPPAPLAALVEPNKVHKSSEDNTDIKKTIKLSKNYIRELNEKAQEERQH